MAPPNERHLTGTLLWIIQRKKVPLIKRAHMVQHRQTRSLVHVYFIYFFMTKLILCLHVYLFFASKQNNNSKVRRMLSSVQFKKKKNRPVKHYILTDKLNRSLTWLKRTPSGPLYKFRLCLFSGQPFRFLAITYIITDFAASNYLQSLK